MKIIGSLPNLQVFKLKSNAFCGREWITNAGEFLQLKFLLLENIALEHWIVDRTHFRNLQHLVIKDCYNFERIPDEIEEISTLRSIELYGCCVSIVASAKYVQRESTEIGWPSSSYC
ncbi:putative late blight resistance protein-like protein R1A-6 [Forsythia ovata]|uniref:Late blight resistance protein-like protein R1A-6 n=1 Tax=Forsythia ovata TaxID=205694 RepID=A0ABD1R2J9_9LAMI